MAQEITFQSTIDKITYENEETLSDRLRLALSKLALSQSSLARKIAVKPQVIQYLCNSKTKTSIFTYKIADELKINPIWLATGRGAMLLEDDLNHVIIESQQKIPLLAIESLKKIIMGEQKIADLIPEKWILTDNKIGQESYALFLKDQSMFPRFEENTLVLFEQNKEPKDGDYVLVYIHKNQDILFRQLIKKGKGAESKTESYQHYGPTPSKRSRQELCFQDYT